MPVMHITKLIPSFPLENDIVSKSFLSLLPDDEKSKIFSKMAFRTAVSNSGTDFFSNSKCLDFKRQITIT